MNTKTCDLCLSSLPVTEFLFEYNLPQVVKELNLTKKRGSRPINKYSYSRNRSYAGNKGYYKQNSFYGGEADQIQITNLGSRDKNTRNDDAK